jgi:hypothetical protein
MDNGKSDLHMHFGELIREETEAFENFRDLFYFPACTLVVC